MSRWYSTVLRPVGEAQAGLVLHVPLLAGLIRALARQQRRLARSDRRRRSRPGRRRCPRSASASGCGRGSRRSRCGSRRGGAGARSGPCSAPCRSCRASGRSRRRRPGSWPGSWCRDCRPGRGAAVPPLRTGARGIRPGCACARGRGCRSACRAWRRRPGRWSAPGGGCGWRECRRCRRGRRRRPARASCGRTTRPRSPSGPSLRRRRRSPCRAARRRTDSFRACRGSTCRPGRTASPRAGAASCLPSLASGGQDRRLVDAVDALVRHESAGPLLVVLRIVLDEQHLARLVDRLAGLDEIDAAVEGRR